MTPTEKLLPQGLQDMLSAQRECMAQANDIHNEIIDREMRILYLPLKAQWYEMISNGIKTEEYREVKPYWTRRFIGMNQPLFSFRNGYQQANVKGYTHVKFSYGYTKRTMTFEIKEITIGKGKTEWGAPKEDVFIIKLGNRIK